MIGSLAAAAVALNSTIAGRIVKNNAGSIANTLGTIGSLAPFTGVGIIANLFNQQVEMNKRMSGMQDKVDSLEQENKELREEVNTGHFHYHYSSSSLSSLNSPRR